jgi:membrane-bound lytic murein transglycosylase D
LAIAAYNCGPGNVNKAIRRSGGKRTFWEIYDYLPRETRGYVPAFIAANYIMTYYKEHNLCPMEVALPKYSDTIVVREKLELSKIARTLNINHDELQAMNPQLKTDIVPGHIKPHTLYFPDSYASLFIAHIDSIRTARDVAAVADSLAVASGETAGSNTEKQQSAQPAKITHRVRSGETFSGIADKYGVTVRNIMDWNNLKSNRALRGQKLTIYTNKKGVSSSSSSSSKSGFTTYVVRRGDNLTAIANRHKVTVNAIKKANNLKSNKLRVGQKLKIPKK